MAYRARKKKLYKKRRTYRKKYGKKAYRKTYGRKSYKKSSYKRKYSKKACKCKNPVVYPKVLVKMPQVNREKVPKEVKDWAFSYCQEARGYVAKEEAQSKEEESPQEAAEVRMQEAKSAAVAEGVKEIIQAYKKQKMET